MFALILERLIVLFAFICCVISFGIGYAIWLSTMMEPEDEDNCSPYGGSREAELEIDEDVRV